MDRIKEAKPDHPIHDLLARRWSPYAYDGRSVSDDDLAALFEAGRWAASCFNEQPWRYILARKEHADEFEKMLSCLVEGNQKWARFAPVIGLGVISTRFRRNDKPNRCAAHDLGAASASIALEATRRGLALHQMAGIVPERAKEIYQLPDGFETFTGLAIGYPGGGPEVPEELRERDRRPRTRRPINETVFVGDWGKPLF